MADDYRHPAVETPTGAVLDALDRRLLAALLQNARTSVSELARQLGVVRATVQTRLERLQRRGIVTGAGIGLRPDTIGYPLVAFVTLQLRQGHGEAARRRVSQFPEVLEMHTTAGSYDVICRIAARSSTELQATIDRLVDDPAIVRSHTSVVLSTPLSYRVGPLIADD